jgi:hypothetical protein
MIGMKEPMSVVVVGGDWVVVVNSETSKVNGGGV